MTDGEVDGEVDGLRSLSYADVADRSDQVLNRTRYRGAMAAPGWLRRLRYPPGGDPAEWVRHGPGGPPAGGGPPP